MDSWFVVLLHLMCYALNAIWAADQPSGLPGDHGTNSLIQPHSYGGVGGPLENQGIPSTTVCVEIRNSPGNPFTICGPQYSSPPFNQYHPQGGGHHNLPQLPHIKEGLTPQPQPSQHEPVTVNQKGLLFQQPQPFYIQPYFPMPYAAPYQVLKYGPSQPNPVNDDSLSMNCKVSGIKYDNNYPEHPQNIYNNMAFRFIPQPAPEMPHPASDTARSLMPNGDPSMTPSKQYNPLNTIMNSHFENSNSHIISPYLPTAPKSEMFVPSSNGNPEIMADYNKRILMELKQQISSLQDSQTDMKPDASNTQSNPHRPSQGNEQKPPNKVPQNQVKNSGEQKLRP